MLKTFPCLLADIQWPEWLFGNPWPIATALICAFVILRLLGRKLDRKPLIQASWVSLGLMAAIVASSFFIETTDKKLVRQTKELAAACVGPKLEAFDALADPGLKVTIKDAAHVMRKGTAVREALRQARIRKADCSSFEVTWEDKPLAKVAFSVHADGALWSSEGMTSWQVYWQETPGGWKAVEMRLVNMPGGPGMLDGLQMPR